MEYRILITFIVFVFTISASAQNADVNLSNRNSAQSPSIMLSGDWLPEDTHDIDFDLLPRVPFDFRVVSDVKNTHGVNQHNYLTYYGEKFWVMWSDGPGVEDRVGQRVKFAYSEDGLNWSSPDYLTPGPPGAERSSYYGTRSPKGFRYIARGFWERNDTLIALASLDEAADFFGPSLQLHGFILDTLSNSWNYYRKISDNAINNFAPKKNNSGEWMMSKREYDYQKSGVKFMVGGVNAIDEWDSFPVFGSAEELSAEEPYWWILPDGRLAALFRDNKGSGFLYRSFSEDDGRTWSHPIRTNFPDARSKFSGLQLKDGRYVLVSNANPKKRDPLVISLSNDGIVFDKMFYLTGGRHVDYPHIIEQGDYLFIAFSGGKQSVEVVRVRLSDLDQLEMISQN